MLFARCWGDIKLALVPVYMHSRSQRNICADAQRMLFRDCDFEETRDWNIL